MGILHFISATIEPGHGEVESLAATGGALPWILVMIAFVLVGAGGTFLMSRRRGD